LSLNPTEKLTIGQTIVIMYCRFLLPSITTFKELFSEDMNSLKSKDKYRDRLIVSNTFYILISG
jgi:hypothetical protein